MIRIEELKNFDASALRASRDIPAEDVTARVAAILKDVYQRGDEALLEYELKFDKARLTSLEATSDEIEAACRSVGEHFLKTLKTSAENIRRFHEKQARSGFLFSPEAGVILGQRVMPLSCVGLYVPGGTAAYPSSVLMNAIPAKIAGVDTLVMATPPQADGSINPMVLAAAKIGGVDRIFKMGGAQAIAALSRGTRSVPRVDKIVGPGNVYVATAKRMVYGLVDIDMVAGPSEILVIADGKSDPKFVAADMLSQTEHDKNSAAVLCTDSMELALAVGSELEKQLEALPRREIARASIDDNGRIFVTKDLHEAIRAANEFAPEHLELAVDDPFSLLGEVRNAGSVFLGRSVPEAMGDYFAGPNHVLPTSGTARFASPLGVDSFVKRSSFTYYTKEAFAKAAPRVIEFAEHEGLQGHGRSVSIRLQKGDELK